MTTATASAAIADRQPHALQTIFSFFLGLMVLAFIGVGVNTFYPSPAQAHQDQRQELQRQRDELNVEANGRRLDTDQQAEMDRLIADQNSLQRTIDAEEKGWARVTSIILVVFATIVMGVSLMRSEQLRVLSNGLLLGGLFTMIYGVGWVVFSGNSVTRFAVMAFALAVAIGLGFVKFVRGRARSAAIVPDAKAAPSGAGGAALADLEARVAALEERAAAAASALGGSQERDGS
ncbi:MAG: hypothetical protein C3F15_07125 [Holophagae bacterium]|nr:MAG: hypothetical protein C3F15_07125 [Holophagae bacterium]